MNGISRGLWIGCTLSVSACRSEAPAAAQEPEPVAVTCATAVARTLGDTVTVRGTVRARPDRMALVSSLVAGRIREIAVHEGQAVRRGQRIAEIDEPSLGPAVQAAAAAVATSQAELRVATSALERTRRLESQGVASRREVEETQAREAVAAAELRSASARRETASGQASASKVASPMDGVVVRVLRNRGESVDGSPASAIAEIADLALLELRADLAPADLVRVTEGVAAQVEIDAAPGHTLAATLVAISAAVDELTGRGAIRIAIDSQAIAQAGLHLRLGLHGRAVIELPKAPGATVGVAIAAAAVRRAQDGRAEVVVCRAEEGKISAQVRPVELGGRIGEDVAVTAGVIAGEQVVIDHVLGLEDGTPLRLAPVGQGPR
jgi:RND family efflux transporter MFP subunit